MDCFFWHGGKSFPFSQISFGFVFGCVLSLFFLNTPVFFAIILLSVFISLFYAQFRGVCFAIGFAVCYVLTYYHLVYSWHLPTYYRGAEYAIQATVIELKEEGDKAFCKVKLHQVNHVAINPIQKVYANLTIYQYQHNLTVGDRFSVNAKLKPHNTYRNHGLPNYELHAFYKGIKAKGYFIGNEITDHVVTRLESTFKNALHEVIKPTAQHGLFVALLFGDKSFLSPSLKEQFKLAGLSHILAISGLHIGIVYSAAFFIIKWLVIIVPIQCSQTINLNRFYSYLGLFSAFIYVWLSDFMVSALRAFLMLTVLVCLYWTKKRYISAQALLSALVVVVLFNPFELLNPGLYFSFVAVAIILLVYQRVIKNVTMVTLKQTLVMLIVLQLGLFIGLMPLSWFYFSGVSLASSAINIMVLPLFSVFLPMMLIAIMIAYLFNFNEPLLLFDQIISNIINGFLTLPLDSFWLDLGLLTWQQLVLIYLVLIFIVFTVLRRILWLPIAALLSSLNFSTGASWKITMLDVGHGLSVVISRNNQALVYDLGAKFTNGYSVAESQILPFIIAHHLTVQQTIISHADNDHAGGLEYWYKKGLGHTVLFGTDPKGNPNMCLPQTHTFEGLSVHILGPISIKAIRNNNSCIVQITDGSFSVLLVGDIHQDAERALIKYYPNLRSNLLISPHHGSKSSSSELFIKHVQPEYVIHANARWSRWNMPHAQVQLRYHQAGVKQMQTAQLGGITFEVFDQEIKISSARAEQRYWFLTN